MNNEVGAVQSERSAVRDGAFNWLGNWRGLTALLRTWYRSWLPEGKQDGSAFYAEGAAYGGLWSTE